MARWLFDDRPPRFFRSTNESTVSTKYLFGKSRRGFERRGYVNNWGAVRDTLRGTRYEKYLPQPIDPIIDPSNPRLPL